MIKDLRKLGKQTIIYGVGNALSRLSAFLLLPIYTTYLSPKEFGVLEILYMTSALFAVLLGNQISHATLRFYFDYDSQPERNRVISSSFIMFFVFSGIILGLSCLFSDRFSTLLFSSVIYEKHFDVLFIWLLLSLSNEILYTYLRATERAYFFIVVSVCELLTKITFCIFFVTVLKWAELGVLTGNLLGTGSTFLLLGVFTFSKCGFGVNLSIFPKLIRYALPLVFAGICGTIIAQADRFFLKTYSSLSVVGLYALGMRFASMVNFLVIQPFTKGYGPFRFSIMKRDDAKELYAQITVYFLFFFLWACLCVTGFAREIIQVMADQSYWAAYQVVPILMISILGQGLYYMFQIGVYINKSTRVLTIVFAIAAAYNLIILQILVPSFGMIGAAVSSSSTQILIALMGLYCSNRIYPVPYDWYRFAKVLFVYIGLSIVSVIPFHQNPCWSIFLKTPVILAYPCILWIIGFFTREEKLIIGKIPSRLIPSLRVPRNT